MWKKILVGSAALVATTAAFAASVPLLTGPVDPGNPLGSLNTLINTINGNTSGVLAVLPAPVTTASTSITTMFSYTLPAGALSTGQTIHVRVYGVNDSNAEARTITFSFGGQTCVQTVTGTSALWTSDLYVTETGSKTQTSECHSQQAASAIASVQATNWAVDNTGTIAILVRATPASTATGILINEAWVDIIR